MEDSYFTILWSFCHTSVWISLRHTGVCSLLNLPPTFLPARPSRLSQSTGFECPASYIKFALAIYFTYGNVCVSMLFSQNILLPVSPKVCSLHLCLFCIPLGNQNWKQFWFLCINQYERIRWTQSLTQGFRISQKRNGYLHLSLWKPDFTFQTEISHFWKWPCTLLPVKSLNRDKRPVLFLGPNFSTCVTSLRPSGEIVSNDPSPL